MKKLFFILIAIVAVVTVSLLPVQAKDGDEGRSYLP